MLATEHGSLRNAVEKLLERYFDQLEGTPASELYDLVRTEVEIGLLRTVLRKTQGNQSQAANMLGIARGTLRKLMKTYALA